MLTAAEVINTVWIGSIYFLSAVGLVISYRITRILNFAHINLMTIGAYMAVLFTLDGPINPLVLIPLVFASGALLAMGMHFFVFSRLMAVRASPLVLMVSSIGIWVFLKYLIYGVLGYLQRLWKRQLYLAMPRLELGRGFELFGYEFSSAFAYSLAMALGIAFALFVFFTRTRLGKALRAVADNPDLAEITGIPSGTIMYITWLIAGGLAALSGLMWAMFSHVTPEVGDALILQIFAASVIGGLYSIVMTVVGSYTISGAENIVMGLLHDLIGIEVSFRPFVAFLILLIVILLRPPFGARGGLPYRFRLRGKG